MISYNQETEIGLYKERKEDIQQLMKARGPSNSGKLFDESKTCLCHEPCMNGSVTTNRT